MIPWAWGTSDTPTMSPDHHSDRTTVHRMPSPPVRDSVALCHHRGSRSSLGRRGGIRLRRKNRRGVDRQPGSPARVLAVRSPSGLTRRAEHYAARRFRELSRLRPPGSVVSDGQLWAQCRQLARTWDLDQARRSIDLNETLRLTRSAELWAVPVDQADDAEPIVGEPTDDPAAPDDTGNRRPPPTLLALTRVTLTAAPPRPALARTTHPA